MEGREDTRVVFAGEGGGAKETGSEEAAQGFGMVVARRRVRGLPHGVGESREISPVLAYFGQFPAERTGVGLTDVSHM